MNDITLYDHDGFTVDYSNTGSGIGAGSYFDSSNPSNIGYDHDGVPYNYENTYWSNNSNTYSYDNSNDFNRNVENRSNLAYNRSMHQMATTIRPLSNNASQWQIRRVNDESESSAWSRFVDRTRENFENDRAMQHLVESAKELALAALAAKSGDVGGAMEHGVNAAVECAKTTWESMMRPYRHNDNECNRDGSRGTITGTPDRDK